MDLSTKLILLAGSAMFKFCNTLSKGNKNININIYFQGNGNLSCSFYDSHIKSTLLFLKSQLHVKFDPTLVCFTPARFLSRFEMTLLMGFWRREGAHLLGLLWAHRVGLYNPTAAVMVPLRRRYHVLTVLSIYYK